MLTSALILLAAVAVLAYAIYRADQHLRGILGRYSPDLTEQELRDELERISHD